MNQLTRTMIASALLLGSSAFGISNADASGYCRGPSYQSTRYARPVSAPQTVHKPYVHIVTKYDKYGRAYQVKQIVWRTVSVGGPAVSRYR